MTKNFIELIKEYQITIPLIQRDYAQGRDEEIVKANNFLNAIVVGANDNGLNLDFVYGKVDEKKKVFIPLDGQQRLTSLLLIYWYISLENNYLEYLAKFSYEVRSSTKDFIKELTKEENWIKLTKEKIREQVENANWFFLSWKSDPTVVSILNMLDLIEEKFDNISSEDINKITFEFLNLDDFELTDELYVKMNARGKPLTEFENFKSEFEKYFDNVRTKAKLDNEWLNEFWNIAQDEVAKENETDLDDAPKLADEMFFNYIKFITEMLAYQSGEKNEYIIKNFDNIFEIYRDEDNLEFLIKSLDVLSTVRDSMNLISSNYEKNKVALFDNTTNIFLKSIQADKENKIQISIFEKILLFTIISFVIEKKVILNLPNYIRICRNILLQDGSYKKGEIRFTPTLAYKDISDYIKIFQSLISDNAYFSLLELELPSKNSKAFELEIIKAKKIQKNNEFLPLICELEDYKYCKGNISTFLTDDIELFKKYTKIIQDIFNQEDDGLIIRSLLTIDDYAINIDTQWYGNKYFFGKAGAWHYLLTIFDKKWDYKEFFSKYLNTYLKSNNLEQMIDDYLSHDNNYDDFMHYFIKYPEVMKIYEYKYITQDSNVFVFYKNNDFKIEKLNKTSIIGYHLNPFLYIIEKKIANNMQISFPQQGRDDSYIEIENKIEHIFLDKDGWHIKFDENYNQNTIVQKCNLYEKDGIYYFHNIFNEDIIKKLMFLLNETINDPI